MIKYEYSKKKKIEVPFWKFDYCIKHKFNKKCAFINLLQHIRVVSAMSSMIFEVVSRAEYSDSKYLRLLLHKK